MVETRTIAFVAVLLVLAAFVAPYASPTGFATASGCIGKPVLTLSKDLVQTGSIVVARIKGLESCQGEQIAIKKDGCYGSSLATITCADSKCSNSAGFTIDAARQDYLVYACIDTYRDGTYWRPGQTGIANLKVVSQPDLKVKSIVIPKFIYANKPFDANIVLENIGVLAAGDVEYKVEFYKDGKLFRTDANTGTSAAMPVILAGKDYPFSIKGLMFGAGSYSVKVTVDPTDSSKPLGRTTEWDENNNLLSLKFAVV